MYYTRPVRCSRTTRLIAPLLLGAVLSADTTITVSPGSSRGPADRVRASAELAVARFDEWLGPLPQGNLIVVADRWDSGRAGTYSAGEVFATSRWLTRGHERSADRLLVAAIARQYWLPRAPGASAADAALADGVSDYLAARAIHSAFLGTHDYEARYLGGFVPHVMRALPLSLRPDDLRPPVRWFAEFDRVQPIAGVATAESLATRRRVVAALFTLERLVGWPSLQVAIARIAATRPTTPQTFAAAIEEVTGRKLASFVTHALDPQATFDYAVTEFTSTMAGDTGHPYETSVTVTRSADDGLPEVDLVVSFADGTETRERWSGDDTTRTFRFASRAQARAAQIDPDNALLVDRDRANNVRVLDAPASPLALRAVLRWLIWLQNVTVTYGALI